MIFQSIKIKEGLAERTFTFTNHVNLVFSNENSKGKTTLLRLMLYSLGYNIPSIRKFRFNNCEVTTHIHCELIGDVLISRYNEDFIEVTINNEKKTYVLPGQLHDFHKTIYGTENTDLLNNILGAIYVDQEKGWTLLNRGTAIGSIRFNIEELIRGLSGCDCSDLICQESQLSNELTKYRQMYSIAKYRESVAAESGTLVTDSYFVEADAAVTQLLIRRNSLQDELKRIDKNLSDNKHFRNFVAEMKILIKLSDGTTVPVTADNIVGLTDAIDFLIAKRKPVSAELRSVMHDLSGLQKEQNTETEQLTFYKSESLAEIFDKKIAAVPIDAVAINKEIKRLEKSLKSVREEIKSKTHSDTKTIMSIYNNMVKYADELGVGSSKTIATSYLFTSNLRELSGAVLHKTVFAFRLAYIIEIQNHLGVKLPIILDSPSGKEVDKKNIHLMFNILKRNFADNQIVIASIYKYNLDDANLIEIKKMLLED